VPPKQALQQTGHATDGCADFNDSSRVSRRVSGSFGEFRFNG
jgi:hypothetical protein